ncbi:SDR family NAD(P)-dependent oxidoreductase [Streptomyces sp. NPDC059680]|uniref:SDR family NAD(P)-dependent oxidoreductase n=1 Tax=Streptomyces sp. NPDC059680 TaxID=3346904 RepID=UPI0036B86C25
MPGEAPAPSRGKCGPRALGNPWTTGVRRCAITGGSRGLGRETASRLAALGLHVLVGSRSAEAGEAAARQLTGEGCRPWVRSWT